MSLIYHPVSVVTSIIIVGWLSDPDARPSFTELETIIKDFQSNPNQYILTIVSTI